MFHRDEEEDYHLHHDYDVICDNDNTHNGDDNVCNQVVSAPAPGDRTAAMWTLTRKLQVEIVQSDEEVVQDDGECLEDAF